MVNNPERPEEGTHTIEFSRELWIERADFKEEADKKFFRMTPDKETRLKGAYIVNCTGFKKNEETGLVEEIYCTYDPTSKAGTEGANRKVKGTIHWVSCAHCLPAEVRNYACLWTCENPRDAIKQYEDENGVRGIDAMRPSSILTAFASTQCLCWKNMCKPFSRSTIYSSRVRAITI